MNNQEFWYGIFQFLYQFVFVNTFQIILEFRFFTRFSGCKKSLLHYIIYISTSLMISELEFRIQSAPLSPLFLMIRIALLSGIGIILLKRSISIALSAASIAEITALLAKGTTASITFLIAPVVVDREIGISVLGIAGPVFSLLLMIAVYQLILKKLLWKGDLPNKYFPVFFLPVLLMVVVEQYIFNQVYGSEIIIENRKIVKPIADHWQVLMIQLFAYFSLFSILYACQKLSENFSDYIRFALLEQELASQREYVEESRIRYEQTQSFRHDIKSHFLSLKGLLEQSELQKAKDYLGKLECISESLSYPCKTGNIVVDTLLNSKLSIADKNGIKVECTVKIPSSSILEDMDLCILFSNAVDNAVHACREMENGDLFIRISGKQKGDFLMIEVENSCSFNGRYEKGIGLSNMETVVEKYHGAMTTELQEGCFRLDIMLVISRPLHDISSEPH